MTEEDVIKNFPGLWAISSKVTLENLSKRLNIEGRKIESRDTWKGMMENPLTIFYKHFSVEFKSKVSLEEFLKFTAFSYKKENTGEQQSSEVVRRIRVLLEDELLKCDGRVRNEMGSRYSSYSYYATNYAKAIYGERKIKNV